MIKLHDLPGRLLVGLSGGADSVALLLLVLDSGAQVSAVHVNHGLRGQEADEDEAFVRRLCEENGILLHTFHAEPPENPGEDWARRVRYGFFREAMERSGADALVLAHHRDDQAETLLLHLLRGAGLNGLCGMAPDTTVEGMRILRPLLDCSREELRALLRERRQPWREDGSNADARYLRNAVRMELLPLMERLASGAAERIAASSRILAEDEAVLSALTEDCLGAEPGRELSLAELRRQPMGLRKRILRAWWTRNAAPMEERSLSAAQTDALCGLLDGAAGSRCNLPGGWHGQVGWTHIHLAAPQKIPPMQEKAALECSLLRLAPCAGDPGDGCTAQALPREWLKDCTVRSRRPGDFIRPFGTAGKQSLQDYLVNRRIDAPFRDRVPLLCLGSEVLLAGGVGAGAIPRMNEIEDPVLVIWREEFPWQRRKQ